MEDVYYVPMSEEQIEKLKFDVVQRYSDLKKRKQALDAQVIEWKRLFQSLANRIGTTRESIILSDRDYESVPSGEELKNRIAELRQVEKEIKEAKDNLDRLGLNIS